MSLQTPYLDALFSDGEAYGRRVDLEPSFRSFCGLKKIQSYLIKEAKEKEVCRKIPKAVFGFLSSPSTDLSILSLSFYLYIYVSIHVSSFLSVSFLLSLTLSLSLSLPSPHSHPVLRSILLKRLSFLCFLLRGELAI